MSSRTQAEAPQIKQCLCEESFHLKDVVQAQLQVLNTQA
jgi:hypothetical protein